MARIPEAEIERLKREVSLERLVEASGIALTRAGANRVGRCPFHEDRTPSLVVTPAKNLWHCLGACGVGGGPIDWVMRTQGVSFRHAVEILRDGAPASSLAAGRIVRQSTVPKLAAPVAFDAGDAELLRQVVDYYHETLKRTPAALEYLRSRGLDDPKAIEQFKLGYADRTLGLRLPESNRKTGGAIRGRLQALGILRDTGHEHFNGSLVIPVLDAEGTVKEIYGRKIRDDLHKTIPRHLYLPGEHAGVWNEAMLAETKEVILCEALLDALTFWCAGYRNVTAAYGTNGFTPDHLAAMKRHGTERVLIAYDRDDAGDKAADVLAERLMAEGIEAWRIQFPKGMDANDYALKVQPAAKSLGLAIRKALWLGKGAPRPVSTALEITVCDLQSPAAAIEAVAAAEQLAPTSAPAPSSLAAELAAKEDAAALLASPVPAAPGPEPAAEVTESEATFTFGQNGSGRRYRVRGLAKNLGYEVMKVNVLVAAGERFYVDTLDLYAAKQRASYVTQAAVELGVAEDTIKADLGRVLLKLEALQEANIRRVLEPKPVAAVTMAAAEHEAAMTLLTAPDLVARILEDLESCGLVGERTNKLVAYLAATSRKLDAPLAVLVQSSSAAGKSSLMDAVLALMPAEERIKYSAVTGQSLFYMGETNLKHKILAIVEEEGASRASYALKLLQSEGELTIASTGKDAETGNLVTQEYRVEGPVMMFLTTTALDIDPELQNRCLVLSVDESREQTRSIHELQRRKRTLEGLVARSRRNDLLALHANAQRLIRPLGVLNPYAGRLTFPDTATRLRRDHEKYLTLIDTIALLHQMSREVKTARQGAKTIEYVEVTAEDIALANSLAHEVLGRSLDELPPQTRKLLIALDAFVAARAKERALRRAEVRFSRRELREAIGWGDTQLKLHLGRLADLEYLVVHREGRGFLYELAYDGAGKDGTAFVPGLIDPLALGYVYDAERSGLQSHRSGPNEPRSGLGRGAVGPRSGGGRGREIAPSAGAQSDSDESAAKDVKTRLSGPREDGLNVPVPLAAARA